MRNAVLEKIGEKGKLFTFRDAMEISSISNDTLKVILHRMEKNGLIERIEKEKYMIIPIGSSKGNYSPHEYLVASILVDPSSISYWSALNNHGLTEQIPSTVFVQTKSRKKYYHHEILGVDFRLVRIKKDHFFGFNDIWIEQEKVRITDIEKTIVDCLHRPDLCGGVIEVAKGLRERTFDGGKLGDYARKMGKSSIIRRLGYLSDLLNLDIPVDPVDTRNYLALDPTMPSSIRRSSKWKLIVNIEDEDLLGE